MAIEDEGNGKFRMEFGNQPSGSAERYVVTGDSAAIKDHLRDLKKSLSPGHASEVFLTRKQCDDFMLDNGKAFTFKLDSGDQAK